MLLVRETKIEERESKNGIIGRGEIGEGKKKVLRANVATAVNASKSEDNKDNTG